MASNHDKGLKTLPSLNRLQIKQEVPDELFQEISRSPIQNEDSSLSFSSFVKIRQQSILKLQSLRKALELNSKIYEMLKDDIQKIKAAYDKNREKQAILEKILKEETNTNMGNQKPPNQQKAISVFAAPYFRDIYRRVPPDNEDTKIKRKNKDVNAYVRPPRPWSQSENKKLLNGVTGFALLAALKPYKLKRDKLKEKLKDKNLEDFEIDELKEQLAQEEEKIKVVRAKPLHELLNQIQGKIDWMTVSSSYLEGVRTPEECENMWNNYLDFSINKEPFSKEEDEKLCGLAEDHKERDWDSIASSLQTERTPIQCFERYQTRLNANLQKRFWTKEEDERLIALVNELKCGEIIPWNKISILMEGRSRQQCINRYDRSISQTYNRGPWTKEEDAMLIACYHKFGGHWAKMKPFFKRRSIYSIRERYVNSLDPSIKMGCWTRDEDRLLISLIRQYGYGKWSKICKKIPGRTDNMCMVRAGKLLEYSIGYYSDQGIEIDPGVYDPELFAKILKPIAPTKLCINRNKKLKLYRTNAISTLLKALKKVAPDFNTEENGTDNFSWLSSENLQRVSEELHSMLLSKEENTVPFVPQIRYFTRTPLQRKREHNEDSDSEQPQESSVKRSLPVRNLEKLNSELEVLMKLLCRNMEFKSKRKPKVFNTREVAEISLYKAYLYKQFRCLALCDDSDDIENVTFCGVDFSETLQTVVTYFVQPPIYENEFIVLAPNLTTITGLEIIEITENRLQSMSETVSHSKNYIDFICERRKSCPKCLQCLCKDGKADPKVKVESVVKNMKSKHFVMTETMETSAYIEAASSEKCTESCSCISLQESQKSVQLLRKRFMGLFLWPSLLATVSFNAEKVQNICKQTRAKDYFMRLRMTEPTQKKRGRKTPLKTETTQNRRGRKKKVLTKTEPTEKSETPSESILLVDQSKLPHLSASDVSSISPGVQGEEPKVQRQNKRKRENSETLRRSKRTCVLRRTSFALPTIKSEPASPSTV